jgi:hypothetical protein
MTTAIARGNVSKLFVLSPTLTSVAVATITTAEQTYTVPGLQLGDVIVAAQRPANSPVGVGIVGGRVSAADTLALTWVNPTAGSVTPAAAAITLVVARPENVGNLPAVFNA